jgi:hypothetical protein
MGRTLHAFAILLLWTGLALANGRPTGNGGGTTAHAKSSAPATHAQPHNTPRPASHGGHAAAPQHHATNNAHAAAPQHHASTKHAAAPEHHATRGHAPEHHASNNGHVAAREHRATGGGHVDHRSGPVHVSNGRYAFPGGVVRTYHPPVIREHYYVYGHRPTLIVENMEPVPGYMWTRGHWRWSGAEWLWAPGYYVVDPNFHVGVGVSVGVGID